MTEFHYFPVTQSIKYIDSTSTSQVPRLGLMPIYLLLVKHFIAFHFHTGHMRGDSNAFCWILQFHDIFPCGHKIKTGINLVTLALNLATKSKCFFKSVAKIASMTRKRKCLNSTWSRLTKKLYSGRDMKRFHAAAAWWFSRTERSL